MKKQLFILVMLMSASILAQSPTFQWAKNFGGASYEEGNGIVTDANGNVFTTGIFQGTVDLDPGAGNFTVASSGGSDIFISKLDATGNFMWAKTMGGLSADLAYAIDLDATGNIFVTGYFQGTSDFDPGSSTYTLTSAGGVDFFVVKIDASGNFLWARSCGTSGSDMAAALKVTGTGDVYVTGTFQNTVDFDPGVSTYPLTSAGYDDIFLLKLDASGNFLSAISIGSTQYDKGTDVHIDAGGNVFVLGGFKGTVDFDPNSSVYNLTSSNNGATFVLKLGQSGNFLMAASITGTGTSTGNSIKTDSNGDIIVAGVFTSAIDFDPGPAVSNMTATALTDIFVLKLSSTGNYIFSQKMGGASNETALDVAVDQFNCIYTTGFFQGTADFDPSATTYTLNSSGQTVFISKLSPNGNFIWAQKIASTNSIGKGITVDNAGVVSTTGTFTGAGDFDPMGGSFALMPAGSGDVFVHSMQSTLVTNLKENNRYTANLYPNPTNQKLNIELPYKLIQGKVILYNILGSVVLTQQLTGGANEIDVTNLQTGVYIISIESGNILITPGKVIKE